MGHAIYGPVIDPAALTDEQLLELFPEFKAFLAELYQSVVTPPAAGAGQTHNEAEAADTATASKSA